ncbi:MAG: Gfo/Idh/MocA family oxidoreductase [Candidatus Woesearchaeota archaeon]
MQLQTRCQLLADKATGEKLKVGIIGLGSQTLEYHIPALAKTKSAELTSVCDVDEAKLQKARTELGVNTYKDYHELLDSENIDFIIAATPHHIYPEIIENAAKRKIHIFKEKPFARNLAEGLRFKRICEENGVHLTTRVQRRYDPIYNTFFQLKEQIGDIFFVDAKYTLCVPNPHEGWRANRDMAGGGCIMDMGYHIIDLIIWYFGLPDKVHAEFSSKAKEGKNYDAEDTAQVMFRYDRGLNGSLLLSRCYPPKTEQINVLGNQGIISIEKYAIKTQKSDGTFGDALNRGQGWSAASVRQLDDFCKLIRGEGINNSSPDNHLQHLGFLEACYASKKQGGYVSPKELMM